MPLGTEHVESGLLLHDGEATVLVPDAGGRWRVDLQPRDERLLGRRVRVHGIRAGFDFLTVKHIEPC